MNYYSTHESNPLKIYSPLARKVFLGNIAKRMKHIERNCLNRLKYIVLYSKV